MTIVEQLRCIKYLNPQARCVVWEGGIVKYDTAHVGAKPTLKECEEVLSIIREQMTEEELQRSKEEEIKTKEAEILRAMAITELEAGQIAVK